MFDASAFQLLFTLLTGWLDRQERDALRYLLEENRVLRRQLRGRRLQLTDDDRRRLAARAYQLGVDVNRLGGVTVRRRAAGTRRCLN